MRGIERQKVGLLPVWAWSIVAGGMVWLLYLLTLGPSTAWWDTSEYIATSYILGLPHPPGNPLFVIVGKAWLVLTSWLPMAVAPRINLLAAIGSHDVRTSQALPTITNSGFPGGWGRPRM